MPVILATWQMGIGGSQFEASLGQKKSDWYSISKNKLDTVVHSYIFPATWEVEGGGS
jgi:hypothetical protein